MYRYNGKVRVNGSVMNEVRKANMSAAEVMILRKLHGPDAVVDLEEMGNDSAPYGAEREKLIRTYVGVGERRTKLNFEQMFGPEHMDLPSRLPDFVKREELAKDPLKYGNKNKRGVDVKGAVPLDQLAG